MPFPNLLHVSRLIALTIAVLLAATVPARVRSAEPERESLLVTITGLRNDKGSLVLCVFSSSDGFPGNGDKAFAHRTVPVGKTGSVTVTFDGLTAGDYAVSLFHDENGNGKLDTHLGIPTEGFGVSNNPRLHWGAPTYKESHFTVAPNTPQTAITIQMRYISLGGKEARHGK